MIAKSQATLAATGWRLALLAALSLFASGKVAAQATAPDLSLEFDHAYVFGDSLSDNGNVSGATEGAIPTSPPYAPGRFSNGPMWVDFVFDDLQPLVVDPMAPSRSYAAGGARTDNSFDLENLVPPGILAQLTLARFNMLLTDTSIGPDDLVSVWAGANNIFDAFSYIRRNPGQFPDGASSQAYLLDTADAGVADMTSAVRTLIDRGARKILVPNLPDLGEVPRFNKDLARSPQASLAADRFNRELFASLTELSAANGGSVNVISMDVEALFRLARSRPADFGFANVTDACINQVSEVDPDTLTICAPDTAGQNTYLFWDEIHPTSAAHKLIAMTAIGLLSADQAFQTPMAMSETSLIAARALSHDVSRRLAELRVTAPGPPDAATSVKTDTSTADGRFSLFLSGSYGSGDRGGNGPVRGIDYKLDTITTGFDARLSDTAVAGLAVSHAASRNHLTDGSRFHLSAWQASLFASYASDGFHVDGSLARGWLDFTDYKRPTTLRQITAGGSTDGTYWAASGNAGYVRQFGSVALNLDAGLRYTNANIAGFAEENAPILGLEVGKQETTSLAASVGAQVSGDIRANSWRIMPYAGASYEAELQGDRRGSGRLIDNTANPFFVDDRLLDDDVVELNAGILARMKALGISLDYRTRRGYRNGGKDEQLSARLAWSF